MILYLCRHGIAEDSRSGLADGQRALTAEGIKKFRRGAKGFAGLEPEVSHILTSPLLRAQQTAEILREALGKEQKNEPLLSESPALAPPGQRLALVDEIRALSGRQNIVVVGHEPYLSEWVGEWCFGREGNCQLKKGAVAALNLSANLQSATLLWLLEPGHLRAL